MPFELSDHVPELADDWVIYGADVTAVQHQWAWRRCWTEDDKRKE